MPLKTKLLTSVAVLSLIGGASFAQENATTEQPEAAISQSEYAPGWNENLDTAYGAIADTRVAELVGMNVVTETGNFVGEVDNFVLMQDRVQAVVGVGGFLGLGEHEVALPLGELAFDGEKLIISYSKEELEAMPEYSEELEQTAFADDDTFRSRGAAATEGAETVTGGNADIATDEDSTAMDMSDGTLEDADEAGAPSGEEVAAAEEAAGGEDTMTEEDAEAEKGEIEQEAEEMAAEADAAVSEGATEVADAVDAAGEAVEEGAQDAAQMADSAAREIGDAVEEGTENVAEAADSAADTVDAWGEQLSDKFAAIADAPVSDLAAYPVASTTGETIGEIEALARHNNKVVALVGVGGFLGLGEHDVALDLNELSFDGEKFIAEGYTKEELEAMPEYDEESIERLEGDVTLRTTL